MKVRRLEIAHFRNLKHVVFVPGPFSNVIYGENAQGKTNLLESIWMFTGARSFRGAREAELIEFDAEYASLTMQFDTGPRSGQEAEIRYNNNRRSILLNGVERGASTLYDTFRAVLFAPEHLSLIRGTPEQRRNFLDAGLCQAYPRYLAVVRQYRRALQQRNALLKDLPRNASLLDTLDIWDRRLATAGGMLAMGRAGYVKRLDRRVRQAYGGISQYKEEFSVAYRCGAFGGEKPGNDEEAAVLLHLALKRARREDMKAGFTTVGPHRDDVEMTLETRPARMYASQGQCRSAVIALKLAEAASLRDICGEAPVVLLDDVMSELDESRQEYLLNHIGMFQTFLTCCDPENIRRLRGGKRFLMREGELTADE